MDSHTANVLEIVGEDSEYALKLQEYKEDNKHPEMRGQGDMKEKKGDDK